MEKEDLSSSQVYVMFVTNCFLYRGIVRPCPTPKLEGHSPVCCPWLLIQYIRSYPPYLKAISSIRNLRTRCAMVTNLTWERKWLVEEIGVNTKVNLCDFNLQEPIGSEILEQFHQLTRLHTISFWQTALAGRRRVTGHLVWWPCHDSGEQWPASQCRGPGMCPSQSM
jgi:hypothetical protein